MAPATIESELSVMNVIGTMTVVAAAAELYLDRHRLPMTGFALRIAMRTVERKTGLLVVIETPLRPVDRRVAEYAVIGKPVSVGVLRLVTRHAVRGCVSKPLRFVAGRTFGVAMLAEQREPGKAMIEEDILGPRLLVMAVLANRSLGALVWIIVLMTQAAGCWRLSVEHRLDVTSCAFDAGVGAAQGVMRIDVMIESQLRPLCGNVARVTAFAKMPLVIIITVMAGVAGST